MWQVDQPLVLTALVRVFWNPKKTKMETSSHFFLVELFGKGQKTLQHTTNGKIVLFQGNVFVERISTKENTALLPRWFFFDHVFVTCCYFHFREQKMSTFQKTGKKNPSNLG